jgi:uncharacterized protein YndB with AHSA1/START domain
MSTVVSFSVPPVTKVVRVACDREQAFERFTRDIHRWWPLRTHSMYNEKATGVTFEPGVGGRILERNGAGEEAQWGSVTAWEPPQRVEFSWHVGRGPENAQTVEVTFLPCPEGTEVRLVHSGWEALAERDAPMRDEYDRGWGHVFVECYADYCRINPSG